MAPWWLRSHVDEEVAHADDAEEASLPSLQPEASPEPEAPAQPGAGAGPEAPAEPATDTQADAVEVTDESGEAADGRRRRRRRRRRRGGARSEATSAPELETIAEETEARAAAAKSTPPEAEATAPETEETPSQERPEQAAPAPRDEPIEADDEVESVSTGVLYVPDRSQSSADERKIAMFLDFENIALGVRDSDTKSFDVSLILERLLEKGKIVVKRAYADWERYSDYKRPLHEAAIELIDIPQKHYSGKNSADIKMVVDAIDLCYAKDHLDTFVLVTGDSDFSPLVSKLKENDKYVIGLGVKNSTSHLLIDNCDEFIYYEDVWRDTQRAPRLDHLPPKEAACFQLMSEAMLALFREGKDVIWGSQLKQTIKRKRPSFSEGYYGYSTFSELLEDAERRNIVRLRRDRRSGGYIVTGFATRPKR